MTEREKKFLDRSWAKYFAEFIFPKIDEIPYAVLYSDKDSRPNTPVNVQIGAQNILPMTCQGISFPFQSMCLMGQIGKAAVLLIDFGQRT